MIDIKIDYIVSMQILYYIQNRYNILYERTHCYNETFEKPSKIRI